MKPTRQQFLKFTNCEETRDMIADVIIRDSCYSTIIAWNPSTEEVEAWHAGPENQDKTTNESLVQLMSFTFDSPDNDVEFLKDFLEEQMTYLGPNQTIKLDDIKMAMMMTGAKALAERLADGAKDDPEGIREAAAERWDRNNREEFVEQMLDQILDELDEEYPKPLDKSNPSYRALYASGPFDTNGQGT